MLLSILVIGLSPSPAPAADLLIGIPPGGMGVDLHVARDEIDLRDAAVETEARLTRFGITLSETYTERLSMGLMLGYARATLRDQPLTAGMYFSGNYAGLNLHAEYPLAERLRIGFMGRILYHWMDERFDDQRVRLEWLQAESALTLQTDLTPYVTLYTGPLYAHIGVDQEARGIIDGANDFRAKRNTGVALGLLFEVDYRGWIGIEARSGVQDGFSLSFQRRF